MLDAYIYAGLRSPFGRHGGALARLRPDDMLGAVLKAVIAQQGIAGELIDDVLIGCANQAGEDSRCIARHAILSAGLPIAVPGAVMQRNCGSGLEAIIAAARAISCGEGEMMLAGGVESMSRAPFVMAKAQQAFSKEVQVFDSALGARFANSAIEREYGADNMSQTADNLARDYHLDRESCDRYALGSQQKYAAALADGFYTDEILALTVPGERRQSAHIISDDEFPRPGSTYEALAALQPLNLQGVSTAGNASGINDGAVALLVASADFGERHALAPMVRILASGVAGVAPQVMGIGPVPAAQLALRRSGLELAAMDVIEINEAFAAQTLACLKALGLDPMDSRVNANGGAISIGHPLGASGPRIALTAARQLQRSGGRYALVSMCIGMGQGIAMVMEQI